MTPEQLTAFVNAYARAPLEAPAPAAHSGELLPRVAKLVAACEGDAVQESADAVWEICTAEPHTRAGLLNVRLRTMSLAPAVTVDEQLTWQPRANDPEQMVLDDLLTVSLLHAVMAYSWEQVRTCSAHDCVDIFIDTSQRRPRKYCSATCLNRARVRAHRARLAQSPSTV